MTFTPELYIKITQALSDLGVRDLSFEANAFRLCVVGEGWIKIDEYHARALITAHWLECLPKGHFVTQCTGARGRWVVDAYVEYAMGLRGYSPTALDALTAYWADQLRI